MQNFCEQVPLETFLEHYADAYFLIVRLFERDDALTQSLLSRSPVLTGVDAPSTPHSSTAEYEAVTARWRAGQPSIDRKVPPHVSSEVRGDLCFVTAIRRSMVDVKTGRLSVGRARSCELWLQHRSVSQIHAWFEFDELGRLQLGDADSKNKTLLDGQRVKDHTVAAAPGSNIGFGAVRTTLCTPTTVWCALSNQVPAEDDPTGS
ncbi:MAG: FHA domain-containing protein [Myxococcales bacterium]